MTHTSTVPPPAPRRPASVWRVWAGGLAVLALAGCGAPAAPPVRPAASPAGQVTPARPAPLPPLPPLPLPEEARACTRHADCVLGYARVVRVPGDCTRGQLGLTAINSVAGERLAAATTRLCGPPRHPCACGGGRPPTCCPPGAMRAPEHHAACVRSRCEVRRGATWTEDEQQEDAAGRGTLEEGECYLASDCPAVALTAFPRGVADGRGRELCPVCPRPGAPVQDEAGRVTALAPRCPRLACASSTVRCTRRRCVREPQRSARTPVPALPLPPEPEAAPEVPQLARGPDYRCARDRDCVLGPPAQCSCGALEPVNRGAVAQRRRWAETRCRGMPCNVPRDREAPAVPVCFEGMCAERSAVAEVRRVRRERARLAPAHQAWEQRRVKIRAAQAPFDEIETAPRR